MYAGVPNVLMSLWSVPDHSTSQIMQYFYEGIKEGKSKTTALRQAKLQYLQEADANTAAPFYWGAFVYLGDTEEKSHDLPYLWILGGLTLIGSFLLLLRRFR
jgi:CHAT domain-containing protein